MPTICQERELPVAVLALLVASSSVSFAERRPFLRFVWFHTPLPRDGDAVAWLSLSLSSLSSSSSSLDADSDDGSGRQLFRQ